MRISGNIKNSDYVNCMKFTNFGKYMPLSLSSLAFGCALAATLFFMYGGEHLPRNSMILLAMVLFYFFIRTRLLLRGFDKLAECNNPGGCTYELAEGAIIFVGSQYSCKIPLESVRDVLNSNGTYYLKFGNWSGFIIPAEVTHGAIDDFIKLLKLQVSSLQKNVAN